MLHTIIWFLYFWLYLIVCIPATLWVLHLEKTGQIERADKQTRKYVKNWARRLLKFAGARVTVEGEENIPAGAAVYIANHTSYFDNDSFFSFSIHHSHECAFYSFKGACQHSHFISFGEVYLIGIKVHHPFIFCSGYGDEVLHLGDVVGHTGNE